MRAVGDGTPYADARDRAVGGLSERDRRLAHELSAGVLRTRRALDHAIDLRRADPRVRDILRLGAYQLHCLTRVPAHAAVHTSVTLAREAAGEPAARYVNQALRRLAKAGVGEHTAIPSHPDWLLARWRERFGAEATARLVAWNDHRPTLALQPVRWEAERLREALRTAGYRVSDTPYGAGIEVSRPALPATLPGYADGSFIVQDASQALVARFAAFPAGARVYDACAAPGGKTVALANRREAEGTWITAGDARRSRLARLRETVWRTGVAVPVIAADLLDAPFRPASWDAILLDAPCSATGTIARHPDARWRLRADAITRLARRQAALLDAAGRLVRPGGVLVYATCSLEREENEDQVERFLERHRHFVRAPVPDAVTADLVTAAGDFQALPQLHGIDGAYAARLVRSAR